MESWMIKEDLRGCAMPTKSFRIIEYKHHNLDNARYSKLLVTRNMLETNPAVIINIKEGFPKSLIMSKPCPKCLQLHQKPPSWSKDFEQFVSFHSFLLWLSTLLMVPSIIHFFLL